MKKLRVYEYAKQLNMSSKEILTILKRLDIEVRNHMSVMNEEMIQQVEQFFKTVKEKAEQKDQQQRKQTAQKREQADKKTTKERKSRETVSSQRSQQRGTVPRRSEQQGRPKDVQGTSKQRSGAPRKQQSGQKQTAVASRDKSVKSTQTASHNRPAKDRTDQPKGQKRRSDNNRPQAPHKGQQSAHKGRKKGGKHTQTQAVAKAKPTPKPLPEKIEVEGNPTVAALAKMIHREPSELIKTLIPLGVMATINQELDIDTVTLLMEEYGVAVEEKIVINEEAFEEIEEQDDPKDLVERPPVVTIMGHVDHGKTTLLDAIRQSKVTAGESGGITQHIGAYQVDVNDKRITFLDTPGHAAFTTMRARGAQVTDITILVVAADDGVMPQTVEAINHAKAANVPIIIAVNKMDKPESNPDRIKQELTEYELVPEEWGGDTIFVPISALKNEGIDELLEMVLLVSEMQELKSNPNKRARGTVIEAALDKGQGTVATVLVEHGTLNIGDPLVAGNYFGKVRAMINDRGRRVKKVGPSTPVAVLGLNDVPNAGDAFMVFADEKKARAIAEARESKQRQSDLGANSRVTLDDLFKQIQEGDIRELAVIIKADVQGSAEALSGSLKKIDIEGVKINIIHTGAGAITESDVILASASNAIIIGFNVRPEPNARMTAKAEKVDIRLHNIIYDAIEEIEQAMTGLLDPEYREVTVGHAEVRQTFKVSSIGTIAGSYVTEGKIVRDGKARVVRDGVVVYDGEIDTLKRFKDDVKEVAQGYECGITLDKFNDIKEGDVIEVSVMEEIAPTAARKK